MPLKGCQAVPFEAMVRAGCRCAYPARVALTHDGQLSTQSRVSEVHVFNLDPTSRRSAQPDAFEGPREPMSKLTSRISWLACTYELLLWII